MTSEERVMSQVFGPSVSLLLFKFPSPNLVLGPKGFSLSHLNTVGYATTSCLRGPSP